MSETAFSRNLAKEIVASWGNKRSNYIVVSPPLNNSRALLRQISNTDFIHLTAPHLKIAIAELDTSDFKDEMAFAVRVTQAWAVPLGTSRRSVDPVSMLIAGVEAVRARGDSPVIVIHRFHEALQKLGEEIGTALRNLEHDYQLKTVVELPISLTCLRERWMSMDTTRAPFLSSDWGQGHKVKLLKGYSQGEIAALLSAENRDPDLADRIMTLTGGIVGLVDQLVEPLAPKNLSGLEKFAKAHAVAICARLLDWLDKPKESIFKVLLVENLATPGKKNGAIGLSDHDWHDILVKRSGAINCVLLAWACTHEKYTSRLQAKAELLLARQDQHVAEELNQIVQAAAPVNENSEFLQHAAELVTAFTRLAGPYLDNWVPARAVLYDLAQLGRDSGCDEILEAVDALSEWRELCNYMCAFQSAKQSTASLRLEEFSVSGSFANALRYHLLFLRLRLLAAHSHPPYLALKSVVEQPETTLQLYSYVKFGIQFWKFAGLAQEEQAKIAQVIGRPFWSPKTNARLDFVEMLYIAFYNMANLPTSERLVKSKEDMLAVESIYDERKRQVHSTAMVSKTEWDAYARLCESWIAKLWRVTQPGERDELISPLLVLRNLALAFERSNALS
jgi:hypothetical protein